MRQFYLFAALFANYNVIVKTSEGLRKRKGSPEENLAPHNLSKTLCLNQNDNVVYRCWMWWKHVRELKSVDRSKTLEFPVEILGLVPFGLKILVRDAYKDLYNLIVWNQIQISDPSTTGVAVNPNSYILTGTPGKFTL